MLLKHNACTYKTKKIQEFLYQPPLIQKKLQMKEGHNKNIILQRPEVWVGLIFVQNSKWTFWKLLTCKSFLAEIADFSGFFGWNNFPLRFWTGPVKNLPLFFISVWGWRLRLKRDALNRVKSQPGRFSRFVAIFFLNRRHSFPDSDFFTF